MREQLKIPSDLEDADEEDDYGSEQGGALNSRRKKGGVNEDEEFDQFNDD